MSQLQSMVQELLNAIFDKFQQFADGNNYISQILEQIRGWLGGFGSS